MAPVPNEIIVREVYEDNLDYELALIQGAIRFSPVVSFDTEFPGTVFHPPPHIPKYAYSSLSPPLVYSLMKQNVDALQLIQLGITLCDINGNLPNLSTPFRYVWQFNFRDFDLDLHLHNPESISLLRSQGIDFCNNKKIGIDSRVFAIKFRAMLLSLRTLPRNPFWVTFHGLYDFGFLIKIMTGKELPHNMNDFMKLVQFFFGVAVYDLKVMIPFLGMHGGLDRVAKNLGLHRVVGKSHQAGSDSLLTMKVFMQLKENHMSMNTIVRFNRLLHGLIVSKEIVKMRSLGNTCLVN